MRNSAAYKISVEFMIDLHLAPSMRRREKDEAVFFVLNSKSKFKQLTDVSEY